jgi:hypothetical protein
MKPGLASCASVYVAARGTSASDTVAVSGPSVSPTAAARGSVNTTRGTAE